MLHNKYFEILKQFLPDYSGQLYGRELIGKVSMSPKNIALTLERLEKENILEVNKKGNMKFYGLNYKNPEVKDIIILTEITNKSYFLKKNRKIAHIFEDEDRVVGIFGSHAKGTQKKDSDVDVFFIGDKRNKDIEEKGKLYDLDVHVLYFSEKEFIKLIKEKNNLCKEIINNHVILFGIEKFVKIIWRDYYGFN